MDPRIKKAYDTIKNRYTESISLAMLAREADLSPYYFQRLFKAEMQESPNECLNRIRLERASHLIVIAPQYSMTEIAYNCGFSSLSSFSRSFLKRFGKSPLDFSRVYQEVRSDQLSPATKDRLVIETPEVVYYPGCWVIYAHTSVFRHQLLNIFHSVRAFSELEGLPCETGEMIGIFTHIHLAFHGDKDQLNYYAGISVNKKPPAKYLNRAFQVPAGRYVCFSTNTSYFDLFSLGVTFKSDWMDPRALQIRDVFSFEIISDKAKNSDHPQLQRRMYVPIL